MSIRQQFAAIRDIATLWLLIECTEATKYSINLPCYYAYRIHSKDDMVDVVGELCESRDLVNIPRESPPDAGDSEEHFQSHELGDEGHLEHFKFDAGYAADSQLGVDRVRLRVGGEKERSSTMPFDFFGFSSGHSGSQKCNPNNHNLVLFHNQSSLMSQA
jgi:hypothetical protein